MALFCIISEIKRDIGQKSLFFHTSSCIRRPVRGALVGILPYRLVWRNTRRWNKFEDMFSRFDKIPACDRQTDRRTDILRQHSIASRGKNDTLLSHPSQTLWFSSNSFRPSPNSCRRAWETKKNSPTFSRWQESAFVRQWTWHWQLGHGNTSQHVSCQLSRREQASTGGWRDSGNVAYSRVNP